MLKTALVLVLLVSACSVDTPWAGPNTPDGANPIDLRLVGNGFWGCGEPPAVLAATSLADLRSAAADRCHGRSICDVGSDERCWAGVTDEPGVLYAAIMTVNECTRPTKEETLLGGRTLYVIHWIGRSVGVCNADMAQPALRLYAIERSKLPRSGKLTVELQVQDEDNGTSNYDAEVNLS